MEAYIHICIKTCVCVYMFWWPVATGAQKYTSVATTVAAAAVLIVVVVIFCSIL